MPKKTYRLGTRKSLLAMAQSQWVASQIEERNPEIKVDLVGITTQGDRVQNVPLSKIEGKEFFVAELDESLLRWETDLTVHSLKDLSLDRPKGIVLAAIPERQPAHDVILFSKHIVDRIRKSDTISIGTSALRRQETLPGFLEKTLPRIDGKKPRIEWCDIRGNVNTRLSRISENPDSKSYLDGVVLALAGLNRLFLNEEAKKQATHLLKGSKIMVVPILDYTSAPAQGALAIECREADAELRSIIRSLHDETTEQAVKKEREILSQHGGGCHQRFGASAVFHKNVGWIERVFGKSQDGSALDELRWEVPNREFDLEEAKIWDGIQWRKNNSQTSFLEAPSNMRRCVFIANHHAAWDSVDYSHHRIWTSGMKSWENLAARGIWVDGCAENLGFDFIRGLVESPALGLDPISNWTALTHRRGLEEWKPITHNAKATYEVESLDPPDTDIENANVIFWGSRSQFQKYGHLANENAIHCSGAGKTFDFLKKSSVKHSYCFPNYKEFKKWISNPPLA